MTRKAFTVDEANETIASLEAVLVGLRARARKVEDCLEKLQILEVLWGDRLSDSTNPDHAEFDMLQRTVTTGLSEVEETVRREISARGIRFPAGGLDEGLLDFPTTWQGRWVYLCWRMGENRVTAWHEVDGGFAGRRPLTTDQARRMGREDDPAHVDDSMLDF